MSSPSAGYPGEIDPGMWNVFLNPNFVTSPPAFKMLLGSAHNGHSSRDLLEETVAQFKTPSLRDLGHSEPYLHTGRMQRLEDVVEFYMVVSKLGRSGKVRNSDPESEGIHLAAKDIVPLVKFLRSLNEDYE
jgi:cytochrome c peroxidase